MSCNNGEISLWSIESFSESNNHPFIGYCVHRTTVDILHVLIQVILTAPYKAGTITILFLRMGKMSQWTTERISNSHVSKWQRKGSNLSNQARNLYYLQHCPIVPSSEQIPWPPPILGRICAILSICSGIVIPVEHLSSICSSWAKRLPGWNTVCGSVISELCSNSLNSFNKWGLLIMELWFK